MGSLPGDEKPVLKILASFAVVIPPRTLTSSAPTSAHVPNYDKTDSETEDAQPRFDSNTKPSDGDSAAAQSAKGDPAKQTRTTKKLKNMALPAKKLTTDS